MNWIESEEEKKKSEYIENERKKKIWPLNLNNKLEKLYNICERINKLPENSIIISQGGILSNFFDIHSGSFFIGDNFYSYIGKHSLKFYYVEPDRYFFDLSICEFPKGWDVNIYNIQRLLYRKEITIKDIENWDEEKIINFFQWFLQKSDSSYKYFVKYDYYKLVWGQELHFLSLPIKYLPGKENATAIYNIESQIAPLLKELKVVESNKSNIEVPQLFRTKSMKWHQISEQNYKISAICDKIRDLGISELNDYEYK